jgi:hypothetical protein
MNDERSEGNKLDYSDSAKLRLGILIDSFTQPAWIYKLIEDIQGSRVARVALVIKNSPLETSDTKSKSKLSRYWENRDTLLYSLYMKVDERRTRRLIVPDAFEPKNIEPLVADCPIVEVKTIRKKFSDWFDDESIEEISKHKLDVALRFGFRILKGRALTIASHGVWSYHHADDLVNRGGPPGFWEVIQNEPTTGVMLQILTEELDNGRVIYRSMSPTSDRFSVRANKNHYYWKASRFVMRKLKELHETGELRTIDEDDAPLRPYTNRLYKTPNNRELFPLMRAMVSRYRRSRTDEKRFFNQWSLRYKFKSSPSDRNDTFYRFKELTPPKDRFWADPFPVKQDDKYFIFIEELVYKEGIGRISVLELDRAGNHTAPVPVLERDYHLSYPFIFERAGAYYMIPETAANRTIELYRSTSFPFEWKFERTLLENVRATDATLFEAEGYWWMFANLAEGDFPPDWNELYLFYTDDPLSGEWKPHRLNPVKSDARSSRPAGNLFRHAGAIYRPAQNSTPHYGYGITINKILRLDTSEFVEQSVSSITPSWDANLMGTHTINTAEDLTVIDCLVKQRR